ncbi:MAG: hypothetical protein COA78_29030 [Blastopirellula sp.]|nr:MAG: hypothetical protein COA78_29030 [Blastopirellula sp.]
MAFAIDSRSHFLKIQWHLTRCSIKIVNAIHYLQQLAFLLETDAEACSLSFTASDKKDFES